MSNLISCLEAKVNEQALLRLKARLPAAFQNLYLLGGVYPDEPLQYAGGLRFIQELFFWGLLTLGRWLKWLFVPRTGRA